MTGCIVEPTMPRGGTLVAVAVDVVPPVEVPRVDAERTVRALATAAGE